MTLRLHNNLTRQLEPFTPLDPACPTLYVCGPTVYNYVHIGNARGPVVFGVLADLLRRRFGACATRATSPTWTTRSTPPRASRRADQHHHRPLRRRLP
jgi:hypothetical protein